MRPRFVNESHLKFRVMRLQELKLHKLGQQEYEGNENENPEVVAEAGGSKEKVDMKKAEEAARKANVIRQLQEIRKFRDAFTPNTIDVNELVGS